MLQTWILRSHVDPAQAVKDGRDRSICGDCQLRGDRGAGRACYVTVVQAPKAVWKAYRRGLYAPLDYAQLQGRVLRIGSYGDPAAVPAHIWRAMLAATGAGWTGYTHQWRTGDPALAGVVMASVESLADRDAAQAQGWRTFRVRRDLSPLDPAREIACPASAEMGHRATCAQCRLCEGTAREARSIAILPHGTYASTLIPLATLRAALGATRPQATV
jgi:hypothetical protein